jgi:hypothetical protein
VSAKRGLLAEVEGRVEVGMEGEGTYFVSPARFEMMLMRKGLRT